MQRHPLVMTSAAALAATVAAALATFLATPANAADAAPPSKEARGKYLVATSGCHDCHTPLKLGPNGPEPDLARMLSGHPEQLVMPPAPALPPGPWGMVSAATNTAHAGPWGTSFTANLTPDAETGLGRWTSKDFVQTIRTGRHMGRGRAVLPPMPIPAYNNMTDEDLEAVFAYLRTVPAIRNRVPEPLAPSAATAQK